MTKKIFRNSLAVGVWVFLLSVALFMGLLYQYFTSRLAQELEMETHLVTQGVEAVGMAYFDGLHTANRITWVDRDGTVLYDNTADPAAMENHKDREEIRQAILGSQGVARRESVTLSQRTIYVAHRLEDGTVIRLAGTQRTVVTLLLSMVQPILLILVITLVFSAVLASRLTKRIIRPILDLDLEHIKTDGVYDELAPLITRIRRQKDTIQNQVELLRQRRQEFTALTENLSEGFLLLDSGGRLLSYNTGAVKLLGVSAPEEEANVLTMERSEPFRQMIDEVLLGRRSQGRLERNGRILQLLADPVVLDQRAAGAVVVLLDVTEKEQGEQMRREFTANVSHELKTPLTAISGMAEIMRDGLVRPEDISDFAEDIYRESQRLIHLVEDIIHLSRLDEGGGGMEKQEIELLPLLQRARERLLPLARKSGVSLEVRGGSAVIWAVPSVLEEMVDNLCENAIKYNRPEGMVVLCADTTPEGVTLTVSDTGIGIPPEDQERVFERFYRVDKSHSKEIGGTGLGLSIVKHGAALHNAQIKLDSQLGQGTRVSLMFKG